MSGTSRTRWASTITTRGRTDSAADSARPSWAGSAAGDSGRVDEVRRRNAAEAVMTRLKTTGRAGASAGERGYMDDSDGDDSTSVSRPTSRRRGRSRGVSARSRAGSVYYGEVDELDAMSQAVVGKSSVTRERQHEARALQRATSSMHIGKAILGDHASARIVTLENHEGFVNVGGARARVFYVAEGDHAEYMRSLMPSVWEGDPPALPKALQSVKVQIIRGADYDAGALVGGDASVSFMATQLFANSRHEGLILRKLRPRDRPTDKLGSKLILPMRNAPPIVHFRMKKLRNQAWLPRQMVNRLIRADQAGQLVDPPEYPVMVPMLLPAEESIFEAVSEEVDYYNRHVKPPHDPPMSLYSGETVQRTCAAISIQAFARGVLARRSVKPSLVTRYIEMVAARAIQRAWRAYDITQRIVLMRHLNQCVKLAGDASALFLTTQMRDRLTKILEQAPPPRVPEQTVGYGISVHGEAMIVVDDLEKSLQERISISKWLNAGVRYIDVADQLHHGVTEARSSSDLGALLLDGCELEDVQFASGISAHQLGKGRPETRIQFANSIEAKRRAVMVALMTWDPRTRTSVTLAAIPPSRLKLMGVMMTWAHGQRAPQPSTVTGALGAEDSYQDSEYMWFEATDEVRARMAWEEEVARIDDFVKAHFPNSELGVFIRQLLIQASRTRPRTPTLEDRFHATLPGYKLRMGRKGMAKPLGKRMDLADAVARLESLGLDATHYLGGSLQTLAQEPIRKGVTWVEALTRARANVASPPWRGVVNVSPHTGMRGSAQSFVELGSDQPGTGAEVTTADRVSAFRKSMASQGAVSSAVHAELPPPDPMDLMSDMGGDTEPSGMHAGLSVASQRSGAASPSVPRSRGASPSGPPSGLVAAPGEPRTTGASELTAERSPKQRRKTVAFKAPESDPPAFLDYAPPSEVDAQRASLIREDVLEYPVHALGEKSQANMTMLSAQATLMRPDDPAQVGGDPWFLKQMQGEALRIQKRIWSHSLSALLVAQLADRSMRAAAVRNRLPAWPRMTDVTMLKYTGGDSRPVMKPSETAAIVRTVAKAEAQKNVQVVEKERTRRKKAFTEIKHTRERTARQRRDQRTVRADAAADAIDKRGQQVLGAKQARAVIVQSGRDRAQYARHARSVTNAFATTLGAFSRQVSRAHTTELQRASAVAAKERTSTLRERARERREVVREYMRAAQEELRAEAAMEKMKVEEKAARARDAAAAEVRAVVDVRRQDGWRRGATSDGRRGGEPGFGWATKRQPYGVTLIGGLEERGEFSSWAGESRTRYDIALSRPASSRVDGGGEFPSVLRIHGPGVSGGSTGDVGKTGQGEVFVPVLATELNGPSAGDGGEGKGAAPLFGAWGGRQSSARAASPLGRMSSAGWRRQADAHKERVTSGRVASGNGADSAGGGVLAGLLSVESRSSAVDVPPAALEAAVADIVPAAAGADVAPAGVEAAQGE
ncbi:unnamed protein product [Pedinophyceae sp. YPF-701]|nr:unnamed protein product [Pedinophyceae sp. YPF-701]